MVGFLSPILKVQAAITVTGCYNQQDILQGTPPLNEAQCAAMGWQVRWVVVSGSPAPTPPASAGTADEPNGLPSLARCSPVPGLFDITKCVTAVSYYLFYVPTMAILWFGGQLFNGAVAFSLNGKVLSSDMVSTGWALSRDVANLFFIFILLYIAIATILQLSSYGMKSLLARLVIIALLVNFSLVVCKVVIDASNILALEFYNKITVQGGLVTVAIFGENAKDISAVFMAGFNPQQLISTASFDSWQGNTSGSSLVMLMLFLMASVMNLVATFVLMAGGLLFIIRIAVLWLLMILAPLAFLFMVLPKTRQYADDWWNKLFNQAFFAPAFLFLFYLVAMMVKNGFLKSIFQGVQANLSGMQAFFASIFIVLLNLTVLAVLMISCLIVAQKMGAVGAGAAQSLGKGAAKWGRGVAGRATRRAAIARPARAVAESKLAQRFAAVSPRFGGAMLRTMQKGAKAGELDKKTEAKVSTGMSLSPKQRPDYIRNADRRTQEEMFKKMSARERVEAKDIGGAGFASTHIRLMSTLPTEEREKTEKLGKEVERKNIVNNIATSTTFATDIKSVKPEEMTDLDKLIASDPAKIRAMLSVISDAHLKKIEDRGDELSDAVIDALYDLDASGAKNATNIVAALRAMGNNKLARVIETGPVRARLGLT